MHNTNTKKLFNKQVIFAMAAMVYFIFSGSVKGQNSNIELKNSLAKDKGSINKINCYVEKVTKNRQPKSEASTWKQTDFAIGLWWPPPIAYTNASTYQMIAQAGFNLIVGGNDVVGNHRKNMLDLASQVGLKCLVNPPPKISEIKEFTEYDALAGFLIKDEPFYNELAYWGKRVRLYQENLGTNYVAAIDLLPSYAEPTWLGPSYRTYVDKAVKMGHLPLLIVNIYPLQPEGGINPEFFNSMETMRNVALEYNIPWWSFMQNARVQWSRIPTETEIRWQAHMLICYGAKGLLYYCYWEDIYHSMNGPYPDAGIAGSLVNSEGKIKDNYLPVKKLNSELKQYGPFLMSLRSTEVSYYGINPPGTKDFDNSKEWGSIIASGPLVVGEFESLKAPGDTQALVLVNGDLTFTKTIEIDIQSKNGRLYKVFTSNTSMADNVNISLAPGDFIIVEIH